MSTSSAFILRRTEPYRAKAKEAAGAAVSGTDSSLAACSQEAVAVLGAAAEAPGAEVTAEASVASVEAISAVAAAVQNGKNTVL